MTKMCLYAESTDRKGKMYDRDNKDGCEALQAFCKLNIHIASVCLINHSSFNVWHIL